MRCAISLALIGIALLARTSSVESALPEGLHEIYAIEFAPLEERVSGPDDIAPLALLYQRHFADSLRWVGRLADEEIDAGFRASYALAFWSSHYQPESRDRYRGEMQQWWEALVSRERSDDRMARFVHRLHLTARDFRSAERVRAQHPAAGLPATPPITRAVDFDPALPAVYTLDQGGTGFLLHNLRPPRPSAIIVVAGCPISKRAARAIYSDPVLARAFRRGNALWLGSADGLDLEAVRQWREEVPEASLLIVEDQRLWSDLDFSAHPNFHFFDGGELSSSFSGWPPGDPPVALLAALRTLGLLDDESPGAD